MKTRGRYWLMFLISAFLISPHLIFSIFPIPIMETAFAANEPGESLSLDLDQTSGGNETFQKVEAPEKRPSARLWLAFSFLVYLLILGIIFFYVWRNQHIFPGLPIHLSGFPASAKVLITLVLLMFGLVHAIGLWDAYLQTHLVFESAEEYFGYMKLAKLVSLSHPHLFGFALMYLLVGGLFILTTWSEPVKAFIVAIPLLSATFDVLSWWMIKMVSADFELLTLFTGIAFSTGFGIMTLLILQEMWLGTRPKAAYHETAPITKKGES